MKELQLAWDTLLLDAWRKDWSTGFLIETFEKQNNVKLSECQILRKPIGYVNYKMGIRVFVANRLEKIGNRMWDQPVKRDAALIAKLQTSKYDVSSCDTMKKDNDLQTQRRNFLKNVNKVNLEHDNYNKRNQKTDWSTVK